MTFYSFDEFKEDIKKIALELKENFKPDCIVAISRGGMTFGHSLSVALRTRNLFSVNSIHYEGQEKLEDVKIFNVPDLSSYKKVLLVDDIIDSGETMFAVNAKILELYPHIDLKRVALFKKDTAMIKADFYAQTANDWIDFFWDIYID